jgi:hypothetical protein
MERKTHNCGLTHDTKHSKYYELNARAREKNYNPP